MLNMKSDLFDKLEDKKYSSHILSITIEKHLFGGLHGLIHLDNKIIISVVQNRLAYCGEGTVEIGIFDSETDNPVKGIINDEEYIQGYVTPQQFFEIMEKALNFKRTLQE